MARQNSEFAMAWSSLSGTTEDVGWRSIPISSAGPIAISAGRKFPGNEEALLVAFAATTLPAAEKLPNGQGFSVERADPHGDGRKWLALTRKSSGSPELFTAMACDVAGALDAGAIETADEPRLLRVFLGRVRAWQEFMRKGAQALSPEAEIGLIGELSILAALIIAGLPAYVAVEGWLGPLDGIQDFEIGTGALEVKSTISSIGFPAQIGSLEQLDNATRQPLYIVGARLRQTTLGKNLPDFIDATRSLISDDRPAQQYFSDRLISAGYFDVHADNYPRRFELAGTRVLEVVEGFPRMTHGTVPSGIKRAVYDIDLDKVQTGTIELATALKKLGAL